MAAGGRAWMFACVILIGMSAVSRTETLHPEPLEAPPNIDADDSVRKFLAEMMGKSPTIRRQCVEISAAAHVTVTVALTARPRGYSRASTTLFKDKSGHIHAFVEIPIGSDFVELLAHELEHITEQIEGVDLAGLATAGSDATYRADHGFETERARKAGTAAAREVSEPRNH